MYFLKCDKCNYYNELKSKDLFLCWNCTGRIKDNFYDWKQKKKNRTYEKFLKTKCVFRDKERIKEIISHNTKHELKLSFEDNVRRRYIEEGRDLDRGGHFEWSGSQLIQFGKWTLIFIIVIFGVIYLTQLF